jgi:PEGA domain
VLELVLSAALMGPAVAPTATKAEPKADIAVFPVVFDGELPDNWRSQLQTRLVTRLGRSGLEVVEAATAVETCEDVECRIEAARAAHATHAIMTQMRVDVGARDYTVTFEVISVDDGAVVATVDGTCGLCGFEEASGMVEARAAVILSTLARLEARAPLMTLRSEPSAASLTIDGRAVGQTPLEVQLEPGPHRIEVSREGYLPQRLEVEAIEGVHKELAMQLLPKPIPKDRVGRALTVAGAVAIPLGLAGVAAGVTLLVLDGDPFRRDCQSDPQGDCRFRYQTQVGGITGLAAGSVGAAAGVALLIAAGVRQRRRRAAQVAFVGTGLAVRF